MSVAWTRLVGDEFDHAGLGAGRKLATGDAPDGLGDRQRRQAGHHVDDDVARRHLAKHAVGRHRLLVRGKIESGRVPIDLHRGRQKLAAVDVLDAPGARVGVDEARPKPQDVDDRARSDLQVDLERGAAGNRRRFGGRRAVDGGAAHRQTVQHQPPLPGVKMRVERRLLDRDRLLAGALRARTPCRWTRNG